ncbi:MAG TPA: AmmeMemoRadiSam system protein B [Kiritimatiellia bacterium]|nr:AmmeMemoRadiSam system protein B [Kiritimatiellia bacterium]
MKEHYIRPAAVSGMFYPEDPTLLKRDVTNYIRLARLTPPAPKPKALIAPHAGYIYSGPIAGTAFACLPPLRDSIKRVVILGPSHRVGFRGIALSSAESFATPLGLVPVDQAACQSALQIEHVTVFDRAHQHEHGLEVHLPFLLHCLDHFSIVPMVVGDTDPQSVSKVIDQLWGGNETLILVSSDLSHYLTYTEANRVDAMTSECIERLDDANIQPDQACGYIPVKGLIINAKKRHMHCKTLDKRNSGDTAGDKHQVVGYGAYAFEYS